LSIMGTLPQLLGAQSGMGEMDDIMGIVLIVAVCVYATDRNPCPFSRYAATQSRGQQPRFASLYIPEP